jgi:hypothetical protein
LRSEEATPAEERQLKIRYRLSTARFLVEREAALNWSAENGSKLEGPYLSAYKELQAFSPSENYRALIVEHCYADIPSGRKYDVIFDERHPLSATPCTAIFRLGIFWRRLPILSLEHGHHQIALFHFPAGVPTLIDSLPLDTDLDDSNSGIILCDSNTWHHLSARKSREGGGLP